MASNFLNRTKNRLKNRTKAKKPFENRRRPWVELLETRVVPTCTITTIGTAVTNCQFQLDGNALVSLPGTPPVPGTDWDVVLKNSNPALNTPSGPAGQNLVGDGPACSSAYPGGQSSGGDGATTSTGVLTDGVNNGCDAGFTGGGSKDGYDLATSPTTGPNWLWNIGKPTPKDDLENAYAADFGNTLITFGVDRMVNPGSSQMAFWFFRNSVCLNPLGTGNSGAGTFGQGAPNPDGACAGATVASPAPLAVHSAATLSNTSTTHDIDVTKGDIFVVVDLTVGGTAADEHVYVWTGGGTSASSPATTSGGVTHYVPGTDPVQLLFSTNPTGGTAISAQCTDSNAPPTGPNMVACATANTAATPAPWPSYDKTGGGIALRTSFPTNTFAEGGLNFGQPILGGGVGCLSSFLAESRTSGSTDLTAALKDFVLGQFNTCSHIVVEKVTDPNPDPTNTSFSYTYGGYTPVTFPTGGDAFHLLNQQSNESDNLTPGAYSVTEGAEPTGWSFISVVCTSGTGASTITYSGTMANITLGNTDTVTCVYTNQTRVNIRGTKTIADTGAGEGGVQIFLDTNGNGLFDTGETSTTTGSNGQYSFLNLVPGNYNVAETLPTGATQTAPIAGATITGTNASCTAVATTAVNDSVPVGSTSPNHFLVEWQCTLGAGGSIDFGSNGANFVNAFPDVDIAKVSDAQPPVFTDTVTTAPVGFTVIIKNLGSGEATGVVLTDPLPVGNGFDINWQIDGSYGNPGAFTIVSTGTINTSSWSQSLQLTSTLLSPGQLLRVHITGVAHLADATPGIDPRTGVLQTFCGLTNDAIITVANNSEGSGAEPETVSVTLPGASSATTVTLVEGTTTDPAVATIVLGQLLHTVQFDPDGPGSANGTSQLAAFDQTPGNSLAIGAVPTSTTPTDIRVLFQSTMSALLGPGGALLPTTGLGAVGGFQLITEVDTTESAQQQPGGGAALTVTFTNPDPSDINGCSLALGTCAHNSVWIIYHPINTAADIPNNRTGSGFGNGSTLPNCATSGTITADCVILRGHVTFVVGSAVDPNSTCQTNAKLPNCVAGSLDQAAGAPDATVPPNSPTLCFASTINPCTVPFTGSTTFTVAVDSVNTAFFPNNAVSTLRRLIATSQNADPFTSVGANSGGFFNGVIRNVGTLNGSTGPDIELQTDASTSVIVTCPDDPAPQPQLASSAAQNGCLTPSLTDNALQPVVAKAIAGWEAAGVDVSALKNVSVNFTDLPSPELGWTASGQILISRTAAGYGWSLGANPTAGQMDLLTVVSHELGHFLGYNDGAAGVPIMATFLPAGVQRTPGSASTTESPASTTGSPALAPTSSATVARVERGQSTLALDGAALAWSLTSGQTPSVSYQSVSSATAITTTPRDVPVFNVPSALANAIRADSGDGYNGILPNRTVQYNDELLKLMDVILSESAPPALLTDPSDQAVDVSSGAWSQARDAFFTDEQGDTLLLRSSAAVNSAAGYGADLEPAVDSFAAAALVVALGGFAGAQAAESTERTWRRFQV